jgi:hypothetical protein
VTAVADVGVGGSREVVCEEDRNLVAKMAMKILQFSPLQPVDP